MTEHDLEAHTERMRRDGYTVIEDFVDAAGLAAIRAGLASHLGSYRGRNSFEGRKTERVYTLAARGKVFEAVTEDPRILGLIDQFLAPGYLLTASQAICIYPGEAAQGVHTDDGFYRMARPRPAASISLIAAVDEFTAQNGATEIIPGSHLWSDAQVASATPAQIRALLQPVLLSPGAAIVFQATLLHQGGANRSGAPRLAFTNQYCQPWCRTQENFFLGVPREVVRTMSPRMQRLLGYDIWPPFMGHVTASHPSKTLETEWVAPVLSDHRDH